MTMYAYNWQRTTTDAPSDEFVLQPKAIAEMAMTLITVHRCHPALPVTFSGLPDLLYAGLFQETKTKTERRRAERAGLGGAHRQAAMLSKSSDPKPPDAASVHAFVPKRRGEKRLLDTYLQPVTAAQSDYLREVVPPLFNGDRDLAGLVLEYYGFMVRHPLVPVAISTTKWDALPVCKTPEDLAQTDVWPIPVIGAVDAQRVFQLGPLGQLLVVYWKCTERGKTVIRVRYYNLAIQRAVLGRAEVPTFCELPAVASILNLEGDTFRVLVYQDDTDHSAQHRLRAEVDRFAMRSDAFPNEFVCDCLSYDHNKALSCATAVCLLRAQRAPPLQCTRREVNDIQRAIGSRPLSFCTCVPYSTFSRADTLYKSSCSPCDHGRSEIAQHAKEDADDVSIRIYELETLRRIHQEPAAAAAAAESKDSAKPAPKRRKCAIPRVSISDHVATTTYDSVPNEQVSVVNT